MDDRFPLPAPTVGALARVAGRARAGGDANSLAARLAQRLASPTAVLLLCALAAAFFWKALLLHQVLLPADILYAKDPLWGPLSPQPTPLPANPLDSDALTEFYPWTALAAGALRGGTLPLWNPYAFAGTPFLGAMQTAVLYPVNLLLEALLAPADVLGARAALHLAATLVGTFLFARRLALSRPAALLAALSFGLGLPYVVWLEHPMDGAVAWLPWMLLFAELVVASRRPLWPWLGLTAAVSLEMLAGHGESTAHALMLCAAYALFRAALARRRGERAWAVLGKLGLMSGALVVGTAVAAAHLLPALAQIPVSEAATDRTGALAGPAAQAPLFGLTGFLGDPAQWKTLVLALAPDFFGNPTWHVSTLPSFGYNEAALYVGAAPLLLAALALLWRRTAHTLFFGLAALVALGMAVRLPLFALLDELPVLRLAQDGRLRFEYAFAVAVLAGYGLDALGATILRRAARRVVLLWLLGLAACAALGMASLLSAHPGGRTLAAAPADAARVALPAAWLALFVGALWLYRRGRLAEATLRTFAPALCAADLFVLGAGYHATVPRDAVAATPPAVAAIAGDHSLYRVAGLGTALWPSLSSLYGLQDVRGYDPAYTAAYERYFAAGFDKGGMRLALAAAGPSPAAARALNLLNVKYLFSACDVTLNRRYYRLVYRKGAGCVYRNLGALPRALLVHDVRWADPDQATSLLGRGLTDPRATALLDPATASRRAFHSSPPALTPHPVRIGLSALAAGRQPNRPLPSAGEGEMVPTLQPMRIGLSALAMRQRDNGRSGRGTRSAGVPAGPMWAADGAGGDAGAPSSYAGGDAGALGGATVHTALVRDDGSGGPDDQARVTSYGLNAVDVAVRSRAPGVLVLADAYAPGWRARVDGHPAPLARADAVFRAVPVPAGAHRVSFTYEPDSFALGARISVAALALWCALLALALGRGVVGLVARQRT